MLRKYIEILENEYDFKRISENIYEGIISKIIDGKEIFAFNIQINLTPLFNLMLPIVIETKNIIPNNVEHHKYTSSNSFCFGFGLHERIIFNKMISNFRWFVEKQIKGFLSAYVLKDLTGVWGADEFSHNGLQARKESLQKLLGIYNFTESGLRLAEFNILYKKGKCYCGSGKDYIDCHFDKLSSLNGLVSFQDILNEFHKIRELISIENI